MESTTEDREQDDIDFPSLPKRLLMAFISPGRLGEHLAEHPKWVGALVVSTVLTAVALSLIPPEIYLEAQREAILERGGDLPEMTDRALQVMRFVIPGLGVVASVFFTFLFGGLYTLVFAFILGDEGRFKQYLAVLTHAWFIAALFGLLLTPLRISTANPQFTVNLGSFLSFLPDGYVLNVFRALDISQIWSTLVFAQGAHAIDSRRSFGSAAAIGLGVMLCFALVAANFM